MDKPITDFRTRLRAAIADKGLKASELSKISGVSQSSISQYMSKYAKNPTSESIYKLAKALDVSEAWLMGYDVPKEREKPTPDLRPIQRRTFPVVGRIACGTPSEAIRDEDTIEANTEIDAEFCLICSGDSMVGAQIYDGDVVFLKENRPIVNGHIYAVQINDEVTLKRVYINGNTISLIAENPAYLPLIFNLNANEVKILGKAVGVQRVIR